MAHKLLPQSLKTVATRSGFKYSTHVQRPAANRPYVLLIHGFPSSAYDWRHQVKFLAQEGYGLIVPDTLGYGESSKPLDAQAYALKSVSDSVIDVVDEIAGKDAKVHGVGHDWGSAILSRAANFHQDRFLSLTFMAGGYSSPVSFDIDLVLRASQEQFGYTTLGYFKFFEKEDAGKVVDSHQRSFFDLLYPNDWSLWKQHMGQVGGLQEWLENDKSSPRPSYIEASEADVHREIFAPEHGGYNPALGYYKAAVRGHNDAGNAEVKPPFNTTDLPTMFVGGDSDPLAPAEVQFKLTQSFAKDATFEAVPGAGHWPQVEGAQQVNDALKAHFSKVG